MEKEVQEFKKIIKTKKNFYSKLIYFLSGLKFPEPTARRKFNEILEHKYLISEKLSRNTGFKVAALDYFQNITKEMGPVRIIDIFSFDRLEKAAQMDEFTGLYNKTYFLSALKKEINRARQKKSSVAVIFMDVDNFKMYNDKNGHLAGDIALYETAKVIKKSIRGQDMAARFGGEEFIVLMPAAKKTAGVRKAEEIRKKISALKLPGTDVLPNKIMSVSGGVAVFPDDEKDPMELLQLADGLNYKAKRLGKNKIFHI